MSAMTPEAFLSAVRHTVSTHEWSADTRDHFVMLLESAGAPLITLPDGYRINVERDSFYESDGDYDVEQERRDLASGALTAYAVLLEKECECGNWNVKQSLAGVVVESEFAENYYHDLDSLPDEYLRSVAAELITEEED